MKKIILLLPFIFAACTPKETGPGTMTSTKIDDLNYEATIVGNPGVSKDVLMGALDKKLKELCKMPYLPRHHKEEVTSLLNDKPNSYTITTQGQCFTKEDMEEYEKSVAAGKKSSKGKKKPQ